MVEERFAKGKELKDKSLWEGEKMSHNFYPLLMFSFLWFIRL